MKSFHLKLGKAYKREKKNLLSQSKISTTISLQLSLFEQLKCPPKYLIAQSPHTLNIFNKHNIMHRILK